MFEEKWLTVNGCKLRVRRAGSGPTLLYLHGANGAAKVPAFLESFTPHFDVWVPEHPGFGESDAPDWLENIHDLAYFYSDFLNQLGLSKVHVIGSSIGGWLAMEMAIREPQRFSSMVLIGSAGIHLEGTPPGDTFQWDPVTAVRNTFVDDKMVAFALSHPPEPATAQKNRHTVKLLAFEPRLHDPMLHKWLHRIQCPVQLAWGDQDKIMPVAYGHAFAQLIPHSQLVVYPNCGHLPQMEQATEFAASSLKFVREVQSS
jgi:pimeloyl-ACP methyl ester carboxylesterase